MFASRSITSYLHVQACTPYSTFHIQSRPKETRQCSYILRSNRGQHLHFLLTAALRPSFRRTEIPTDILCTYVGYTGWIFIHDKADAD